MDLEHLKDVENLEDVEHLNDVEHLEDEEHLKANLADFFSNELSACNKYRFENSGELESINFFIT